MTNKVYVGTRGNKTESEKLAPVVQGSTDALHTITVQYANGDAYDLTGKTVTGVWWDRNEATTVFDITGTLTVTDAANGMFTWDKSAADVGTPGILRVQFIITAAGDGETDATFPAAMTVTSRAEATNVVSGDTIDGGSATTTATTSIDGGDA